VLGCHRNLLIKFAVWPSAPLSVAYSHNRRGRGKPEHGVRQRPRFRFSTSGSVAWVFTPESR
jgi:hypothetical protein